MENDVDLPVVISRNEARGGVTEHRVHYVLAFGLAGSIIALFAIGLYFGYGKLTQTISQTLIRRDATALVSYAIPIALAAVTTVLLLGLWNMMLGGRSNTSQTLMRWRVVLQFIALCLVMTALYLSGKY